MHKQIAESGLGLKFDISPITSNETLAKFLNKEVKYKAKFINDPAFIRAHGQMIIASTFIVKETQFDYKNEEILRGYATFYNDTFGRCINPEHIEIVEG